MEINNTNKESNEIIAVKTPSVIVKIILPVFIFLLCAGIVILCSMRPYEKLQTYLNIAFMGNVSVSDSDGFEIKQNEIDTNYTGKTSETGETVMPVFGEQYAILSCDKIGLYVPVYWGTNSELLEHGACQSTSSSLAGEENNSVISAHVNTFFSDIKNLEVGDSLTLYTTYGKFTYVVSELIEFENNNKQYVIPTEDERLTLYTCEMQVFGSSDKRVGVVCHPTEKQFYIS